LHQSTNTLQLLCHGLRLVDTARIASISSMHAASASSLWFCQHLLSILISEIDITYLETGPPGQASPQLHKRARHLVAHGSMALVVMYRRSGGSMSVVASTCRANSLGGSSGGSRCRRTRSVGLAASAEKTGFQARTSSGARGAGSSGCNCAAG
jgi:hypothetical protein